jgi:hypothetical protein
VPLFLVGGHFLQGGVLLRFQRGCLDLVGELLGQAPVSGVDFALDLGEPRVEIGGALGPQGSLVVHAPRAERAGPPGAALLAGGDGGLLGVLLFLARDEGAAAGLSGAGPSDLHFGAVQADGDAAGGRVGEQVGQGPQPMPGSPGTANPRAASSGRTS